MTDKQYSIDLRTNFLRYSSSDVQRLLRKYENSKEKFAVKMVLTRDEGSMFYYGSIETGMNKDLNRLGQGFSNAVFTAEAGNSEKNSENGDNSN